MGKAWDNRIIVGNNIMPTNTVRIGEHLYPTYNRFLITFVVKDVGFVFTAIMDD